MANLTGVQEQYIFLMQRVTVRNIGGVNRLKTPVMEVDEH